MTDEAQGFPSEPQAADSVIAPDISSPEPKKSNNRLWMIVGAGSIGVVICLCSILCIALMAGGVGAVLTEKAPIESVLDAFMKDMEAKDIESAYALFSPRSQRQTPIKDLEKLTQGNYYALFEGYESLVVKNLNINISANTNPNSPQGNVANVTGSVSYNGKFTGSFTAVLEQVDGKWKIFRIDVTVPPDKVKP